VGILCVASGLCTGLVAGLSEGDQVAGVAASEGAHRAGVDAHDTQCDVLLLRRAIEGGRGRCNEVEQHRCAHCVTSAGYSSKEEHAKGRP